MTLVPSLVPSMNKIMKKRLNMDRGGLKSNPKKILFMSCQYVTHGHLNLTYPTTSWLS